MPNWVSPLFVITGGVLLSVYISSIWPVLTDQVSLLLPAKTTFVVALTWMSPLFVITGGVVLSVYISSIWPVLVDQVTLSPPSRTMFVAALTWLVQILFSVWTVAYNFVPGGEYMREKSLWLVVVC